MFYVQVVGQEWSAKCVNNLQSCEFNQEHNLCWIYRYTMVWVMGCLSVAHLYRTLTDYGGYHLDITG